jgi:DNA-binding transcriptional ArsR family regulator
MMEFTIVNNQGEENEKAVWMRVVKLLGTLAVLSLLMAPALAEQTTKNCACASGDCHGSHMSNCCGKCSDTSSLNQGCSCSGQIALLSSIGLYDPAYSVFGKGSSRQYSRQSSSAGLTCSEVPDIGSISSPVSSPVNPNDIGPPDPDVVDCLPSSAKQVFNALASDGPLTQKELIRKTDLPPRTVRYALSRLKGEDMLAERFCFRDARQSLYTLIGADLK